MHRSCAIRFIIVYNIFQAIYLSYKGGINTMANYCHLSYEDGLNDNKSINQIAK